MNLLQELILDYREEREREGEREARSKRAEGTGRDQWRGEW